MKQEVESVFSIARKDINIPDVIVWFGIFSGSMFPHTTSSEYAGNSDIISGLDCFNFLNSYKSNTYLSYITYKSELNSWQLKQCEQRQWSHLELVSNTRTHLGQCIRWVCFDSLNRFPHFLRLSTCRNGILLFSNNFVLDAFPNTQLIAWNSK